MSKGEKMPLITFLIYAFGVLLLAAGVLWIAVNRPLRLRRAIGAAIIAVAVLSLGLRTVGFHHHHDDGMMRMHQRTHMHGWQQRSHE
ncbi:hypothetical protein [Lacticaseibacillus saniviri]